MFFRSISLVTTFACNATRFAVVFFFSLFVFFRHVFGRTANFFCLYLLSFLLSFFTKEAWDQDQPYSLKTLANCFVIVVSIVKFRLCDLNTPCVLEIAVMEDLTRTVCILAPQPLQSITFLLPQYLWPPKSAGWWLILRGLLAIKVKNSLISQSSQTTWQTKTMMSTLPYYQRPPILAG